MSARGNTLKILWGTSIQCTCIIQVIIKAFCFFYDNLTASPLRHRQKEVRARIKRWFSNYIMCKHSRRSRPQAVKEIINIQKARNERDESVESSCDWLWLHETIENNWERQFDTFWEYQYIPSLTVFIWTWRNLKSRLNFILGNCSTDKNEEQSMAAICSSSIKSITHVVIYWFFLEGVNYDVNTYIVA